jgi:hypothetical protein
MITAIQNFLLKHNTWLFSILLVVIIVTFVLTIGNQSFGGSRTFESQSREYYGYDLNSRGDMSRAGLHANLSLQMDMMNKYTSPGFMQSIGGIEDYAFVRIAALGLANQLGIPNPNEEQLAAFLKKQSAFQNQATQTFDPSAYTRFKDSLAANPNADESTIGKVLREDYRIQRVLEALAGPGYMLPFEGEKGFLMQQTEWTVRVATTNFDAFNPTIVLTDEDLLAYYEENPLAYTLPERVRVSTIHFRAANSLDEVPMPAEATLESYFNQNRFRYRVDPPADAPADAPPPEVTLEAVREQVVADYRRAEAIKLAQAKSEEFVGRLYEEEIPLESEGFTALLNQLDGEIAPQEPYDRPNPPAETGLSNNLLQSAWIYANNTSRYYSDLEATSDGAGLIVVHELLEEALQPYEVVAAQVREDLLAEEKRRLFAEQVAAWEDSIEQDLASGMPFTEAAEQEGFAVLAPDTFKATSLPAEINRRIWDATQILDKGEHSDFVIEETRAVMTYVVDKVMPTAEAATTPENTYFENLVAQRKASGGWFALAEWTSDTLKQLNPDESEAQL